MSVDDRLNVRLRCHGRTIVFNFGFPAFSEFHYCTLVWINSNLMCGFRETVPVMYGVPGSRAPILFPVYKG